MEKTENTQNSFLKAITQPQKYLAETVQKITQTEKNGGSTLELKVKARVVAILVAPVFLILKVVVYETPLGVAKVFIGIVLIPQQLFDKLTGNQVVMKNYSIIAPVMHLTRIIAFVAVSVSSPLVGAYDPEWVSDMLTDALALQAEYADYHFSQPKHQPIDLNDFEDNESPEATGSASPPNAPTNNSNSTVNHGNAEKDKAENVANDDSALRGEVTNPPAHATSTIWRLFQNEIIFNHKSEEADQLSKLAQQAAQAQRTSEMQIIVYDSTSIMEQIAANTPITIETKTGFNSINSSEEAIVVQFSSNSVEETVTSKTQSASINSEPTTTRKSNNNSKKDVKAQKNAQRTRQFTEQLEQQRKEQEKYEAEKKDKKSVKEYEFAQAAQEMAEKNHLINEILSLNPLKPTNTISKKQQTSAQQESGPNKVELKESTKEILAKAKGSSNSWTDADGKLVNIQDVDQATIKETEATIAQLKQELESLITKTHSSFTNQLNGERELGHLDKRSGKITEIKKALNNFLEAVATKELNDKNAKIQKAEEAAIKKTQKAEESRKYNLMNAAAEEVLKPKTKNSNGQKEHLDLLASKAAKEKEEMQRALAEQEKQQAAEKAKMEEAEIQELESLVDSMIATAPKQPQASRATKQSDDLNAIVAKRLATKEKEEEDKFVKNVGNFEQNILNKVRKHNTSRNKDTSIKNLEHVMNEFASMSNDVAKKKQQIEQKVTNKELKKELHVRLDSLIISLETYFKQARGRKILTEKQTEAQVKRSAQAKAEAQALAEVKPQVSGWSRLWGRTSKV